LEAAAAATNGGGVSSSDLEAVKADVETLKDDTAQLNATLTTTLSQVEKVEEAQINVTNALSNVVYGDEFHPGGNLDFTPGSALFAHLEKALVGVKVFLSSINILGTNIKGSVLSRLLKDVTTIGGALKCESNQASFEGGDAELVFQSLASVTEIQMDSNSDKSKQRFTGASFPALTFVRHVVNLYSNPMLKTIYMPNLAGIGNAASFGDNDALTSLQLPSLITVMGPFAIDQSPSLATDKVQVSQDFESVGGRFDAFGNKAGFKCTAENGLRAVVAKASSFYSSNPATCKK